MISLQIQKVARTGENPSLAALHRKIAAACRKRRLPIPSYGTVLRRLRAYDARISRGDWDSHVVIINNAPWRRTWINRREYVHPYEVRQYRAEERLPERHVLHERTEHERTAAREGRHRAEEHRDHRSR
jgi:hypothetical protein